MLVSGAMLVSGRVDVFWGLFAPQDLRKKNTHLSLKKTPGFPGSPPQKNYYIPSHALLPVCSDMVSLFSTLSCAILQVYHLPHDEPPHPKGLNSPTCIQLNTQLGSLISWHRTPEVTNHRQMSFWKNRNGVTRTCIWVNNPPFINPKQRDLEIFWDSFHEDEDSKQYGQNATTQQTNMSCFIIVPSSFAVTTDTLSHFWFSQFGTPTQTPLFQHPRPCGS